MSAPVRHLPVVGDAEALEIQRPRTRRACAGDGESPANDRAPAAMGAEEDDVSKTKAPRTIAERVAAANAARVTTPAAGARCGFPGCTDAPIPWRASLDAVLRPFCKAHRTRAQSIRCVRKLGAAEAVAVLLAGEGATPDEALAALAAAVEGEATARVEAIRAALEGRP